jgi:Zinc finger, ZZ type
MSSKFTELIVDENSTVGAGTRIKLFDLELSSFRALKATLTDCTRFDPSIHKLGYIDTESEVIELMDECDWITCVEEATSAFPAHPLIGVIIVGKNQKWNREQLSLTNSVMLTRSVAQTSPTPNKLQESIIEAPRVSLPEPAPPKSESSKLAPQPQALVQIEQPSSVEQTPALHKPAAVATPADLQLTKSSSSQHPKEYSYRFSYTETELEVVRKVPLSLFGQLESILAAKYEDGLVQGERAFKVFLEQQNKKKVIDHQKQVADLQQKIESLKKELLASRIETKTAQAAQTVVNAPADGLFSNVAVNQNTMPVVNEKSSPASRKASAALIQREGQGQSDKYLHLQVSCDGCGVFPMAGIRYKALEKEDFDLCESCFLNDSSTQDAYLALRETNPNSIHMLTQLARASTLPKYQQENKKFLNLHKWNDNEFKFRDLAFE